MLRGLRALLSFLTRIPTGVSDPALAAESLYLAPIIGVIEGAIIFSALAVLSPFAPAVVLSAFYTLAHFLLTGGIHIDGFADYAEALWSGRRGEEMLRIMKDPRKGVFGVSALIINFLMSYAGAYGIIEGAGLAGLLVTLVLVYTFSAESLYLTALLGSPEPYDGLGRRFVEGARGNIALNAATLLPVAMLLAASSLTVGATVCLVVVAVLASSALTSIYTASSAKRRLGFVSGDVLGFSYEASRLAGLFLGGIAWL